MTDDAAGAAVPAPRDDLLAAVREIDRHAAQGGWDQAPRLYALVPTDELLRAEPSLADTLGPEVGAALTPVEQEDLPLDEPLSDLLARIEWPAEVVGCALVMETVSLPDDAVPPEDADAAGAWAATHPRREEGRLTVGVLRDGSRASALRWRSFDSEADIIVSPELAPTLSDALATTLDG